MVLIFFNKYLKRIYHNYVCPKLIFLLLGHQQSQCGPNSSKRSRRNSERSQRTPSKTQISREESRLLRESQKIGRDTADHGQHEGETIAGPSILGTAGKRENCRGYWREKDCRSQSWETGKDEAWQGRILGEIVEGEEYCVWGEWRGFFGLFLGILGQIEFWV